MTVEKVLETIGQILFFLISGVFVIVIVNEVIKQFELFKLNRKKNHDRNVTDNQEDKK
jgi:hypothetical protein